MSDDLDAREFAILLRPEQIAVMRLQLDAASDLARAIRGLLGPHTAEDVDKAHEALDKWKRAIGYQTAMDDTLN